MNDEPEVQFEVEDQVKQSMDEDPEQGLDPNEQHHVQQSAHTDLAKYDFDNPDADAFMDTEEPMEQQPPEEQQPLDAPFSFPCGP